MKIFKNKQFWVILGIILLILLIYVGGSRFRLPLNNRLLLIIGIMSGGMLYLLFKQVRANRGAKLLEKSIKAQADEQKMSQRPDKKGEIEELKHDLVAAIESLKKSRLGKGGGGKAALYALPWYMFIGPPAAGKTTAIINSGLEFSFGSDIKGVGGTRNCDWFFSNSTILLDTAGRYTTEEEDREEWNAFLDMLKKYRRKNPINGVIIGMSITDVLNATHEDVEWHAKNIRHRIDELIQRLGIRFPVYLVFTKCDLLQGFVEIFEDLDKRERGQIWGCTFTSEQQSSPNPRDVFDREFRLLFQQLNNMRLRRLSSPTKPENRSKAFVFPLEFASIKDRVGHFIARLFQPSPYKDQPIFRGFYLTSGTQEGVPIDRVIQAIAKQFDLPAELMTEPEVEKKSYFINKLFTDVIIPDQKMVARTSRASVRQGLLKKAVIGIAAAALAAFMIGIGIGYGRSRVHLKRVEQSAEEMRSISWISEANLSSNFQHMDKFFIQLQALEKKEAGRPLIHLGLYPINSVLLPARELFYQNIREFVKKYLYSEIQKNLEDYRYTYRDYDDEEMRNYLRAYLLMGPEIERLDEKEEPFLIRQLTALSKRFSKENAELQTLMADQLKFFVERLGEEGIPAFESNEFLIRDVRNILREVPSAHGIYSQIIRESPTEFPGYSQLSLSRNIKDQDYRDILVSSEEVPGVFTKLAWDEYVRNAIREKSQGPLIDWLYGEVRIPEDLSDPDKLAQELEGIYFEEYAEAWWKFIQSINCGPFESVGSASEILKKLGHPAHSPYVTLIKDITEETSFEGPGPLEAVKKPGSLVTRVKEKVAPAEDTQQSSLGEHARRIDSEFAVFHSLSPSAKEGEEAQNALTGLLGKYSEIGAELESLLDDIGPRSKDCASKTFRREGTLSDAVKTIRETFITFDLSTREKCQSLLERPVLSAWIVLLNETQSYLSTRWRSEVFDEYRSKLERYYPFDRNSLNDATIMDVHNFFQPETGTMWKFFKEECGAFVDTATLNPLLWEGYGIDLSSRAKEAFRKSKSITEALFPQGQLEVKFRLQPELPKYFSKPSPAIERVILNINGKEFLYRMGGIRPQEFTWPGYETTPFASLQVIIRDIHVNPLRFERDWGWFRLLNAAEEITQESPLEYKILWVFSFEDTDRKLKQVGVLYTLRATSTNNPFANFQDFFSLHLPERLNPNDE